MKYHSHGKRPDSVGLFWEEFKEVKIDRVPPESTWLDDDYLPNLDQALEWSPDLWTPFEMFQAAAMGEKVVFDIEHYPNYFLIMFKSVESGKICFFEKTEDVELAIPTLLTIVKGFCLIGFNSKSYDIPMLILALSGASFQQLHDAENFIIKERWRPYQVLQHFKIRSIQINHIDLIEVAPLAGSLKEYGGRMHTLHMQDLPFAPAVRIEKNRDEKFAILRFYCGNDLTNTEDLYNFLEKDLELREKLGIQYGLDLRSKSDAQIAEAVVSKELQRLTGIKPKRAEVIPFTVYNYQIPEYLTFKTDLLKWVVDRVVTANFIVNEIGRIDLPQDWKEVKKTGQAGMKFTINETTYQMGIGGLHSCENGKSQFSDDEFILIDRDVASYYPFIILNHNLFPKHLGRPFLDIFRKLVKARLAAKAAKDKLTAGSLKITINGTFGKLGNKWSIMYSPRLMLQVTITGQLCLLYLIEKIELAGIRVISANTDGIVIKCPRDRKNELDLIVREWEQETNFKTDENQYHALLSRSVNDYMAVMTTGKVKGKGGLGWGITPLFKNPANNICIEAIENFLSEGISIESTVRSCADVRKFVSVRKVTGGAVWQGKYLGKAVRWYYSDSGGEEIIYAKSGNKVSRSDGAKPLMILPDTLPDDLDYERYISEAHKMLSETGYPCV
jgi:hypothetical protein